MKKSLSFALAAVLFAPFASIAIAAPTIPAPHPPMPSGGVTAPTIPAPHPPMPSGGIN